MPQESVFICYRRDDSGETAGRIFDRLTDELPDGAVFRDLDSIPLGADFRLHVRDKLATARVVLVLIGRDWLTIRDARERLRLEDAADHVRVEVELALRTPNARVIPILCRHAVMPAAEDLPETMRDLAFKNGQAVRPDPDFRRDMEHLIKEIRRFLDEPVNVVVAKPVQTIAVGSIEKATLDSGKNAAANPTAPIANPGEKEQGKKDATPVPEEKKTFPSKSEEKREGTAGSAQNPPVVPPKPEPAPWQKTVKDLLVVVVAVSCWGLMLWGAILGIRYAAVRAGEGIEWIKKRFTPTPTPTPWPKPTLLPKPIIFPTPEPSLAERIKRITKPKDGTTSPMSSEINKLFPPTPTPFPIDPDLAKRLLSKPTPPATDAPPGK